MVRFVVLTLGWISFVGLCVFTLIASIPLQEDVSLSGAIRFDPEAAGLMLFSAWLTLFCGMGDLLFSAWHKKRKKTLLVITALCLLITGYRIVSIHQYDDQCQHVQTSVCIIQHPKALPLW